MSAYKHNELRCPVCDYKLEAATSIVKDEVIRPKDGDFAVCLSCGVILRYLEYKEGFMVKITTKEALIKFSMEQPADFLKLIKTQFLIRNTPMGVGPKFRN